MRLFLDKVTIKEITEETDDYYIASAEGVSHPVICWKMLFPRLKPGDDIIINTTAVRLELGTGGYHIGLSKIYEAVSIDDASSHLMKLNYTPLQHARPHLEELEEYKNIKHFMIKKPVVIFTLHSQLFAAGYFLSKKKLNYVVILTDENALPAFLSKNLALLKKYGGLKQVITTGQAFGGDIEAVNVYSALAFASEAIDCDLILIGPSFGTRGSGTYLGHSAMSALQSLHAAYAGGVIPYLAARASFADQRERHRGISHHTREIAELSLCQFNLVLPALDILNTNERELIEHHLHSLNQTRALVKFVDCSSAHALFSKEPELFRSMGRNYHDDLYLFLSAAAPLIEVLEDA